MEIRKFQDYWKSLTWFLNLRKLFYLYYYWFVCMHVRVWTHKCRGICVEAWWQPSVVSFFIFSQDLGLELRLSDLGGKLLYLLSHLVGLTLGKFYLLFYQSVLAWLHLPGKWNMPYNVSLWNLFIPCGPSCLLWMMGVPFQRPCVLQLLQYVVIITKVQMTFDYKSFLWVCMYTYMYMCTCVFVEVRRKSLGIVLRHTS